MDYSDELQSAGSELLRTDQLFEFLCDDEQRPALYAELRRKSPVYEFHSRARNPEDRPGKELPQRAFLLTRRKDIEEALQSGSNSPYQSIGSGTFVLALDNGAGHEPKRDFLLKALRPASMTPETRRSEIHHIAALACRHAMVAPTKNDTFDLVTDVAEQATLRFVAAYFGIPDQYHLVLQETMRRTYAAMIYQMFARHFVTDPLVLPEGNAAMGSLARTLGALIAEVDTAPLAAKLMPVIAMNPQSAQAAFKAVAEAVGTFDSLRPEATAYLKATEQPGLASRAARLLDRILELAPVRLAIEGWITSSDGTDEAMQVALLALIADASARKQQRDEQLVPRTFVLNGDRVELPSEQSAPTSLHSRESLLERMARSPEASSGGEVAVALVGTMAGLVGNVIAGACISIERFFSLDAALRVALVEHANKTDTTAGATALLPFIQEALRLQPPAAFVPRRTVSDTAFHLDSGAVTVPAGVEIVIPLGAATRDLPDSAQPDAFDTDRPPDASVNLFGHAGVDARSHRCVGDFIAMPLIAHIVRSVLSLPGLARVVKDNRPVGLKKKWGYLCVSSPLQFKRNELRVQNPLNVVMQIRTPTAEHAAALKLLLQSAAPNIEILLARSGIVHFARFLFLNNDTQLGLFTVYDGDFKPYIEYFAGVAGPLFDKIFEHVEDAPPAPVRKHAAEFVEHIARFDVPSAAGYFFSAHPTLKVR